MSARTGDPVHIFHGNDNNRISGDANGHQSSVGDVSGLASCQVWEAGVVESEHYVLSRGC